MTFCDNTWNRGSRLCARTKHDQLQLNLTTALLVPCFRVSTSHATLFLWLQFTPAALLPQKEVTALDNSRVNKHIYGDINCIKAEPLVHLLCFLLLFCCPSLFFSLSLLCFDAIMKLLYCLPGFKCLKQCINKNMQAIKKSYKTLMSRCILPLLCRYANPCENKECIK